jgi:hypothetical protein
MVCTKFAEVAISNLWEVNLLLTIRIIQINIAGSKQTQLIITHKKKIVHTDY